MIGWLREITLDLTRHGLHGADLLRRRWQRVRRLDRLTLCTGALLPAVTVGAGLWSMSWFTSLEARPERERAALPPLQLDLKQPVREEPRRFLARSHLPRRREESVAGAPRLNAFFAQYDLVRVDDPRVWWESDNDHKDTEDDHLMHRALEEPFRRLVELVAQAGGTLEVHDAYRAEGIHAPKSLHREGRAVDMTCDQLGLEKLAKLAWAAGFDWVYHEVPRRGGAHVHASVREDRPRWSDLAQARD